MVYFKPGKELRLILDDISPLHIISRDISIQRMNTTFEQTKRLTVCVYWFSSKQCEPYQINTIGWIWKQNPTTNLGFGVEEKLGLWLFKSEDSYAQSPESTCYLQNGHKRSLSGKTNAVDEVFLYSILFLAPLDPKKSFHQFSNAT